MEKHLAEIGKETCMGDSDSQVPRAEHVWASEASYVTIALKAPSTQTKSHPSTKVQGSIVSHLCSLHLYKFCLQPGRAWSLPCAEEIQLHELSAKEKKTGKRT